MKFCIVGGLGFAVNGTVLVLFANVLHVPFYAAQIIGAETALLTNFLLHDTWTFNNLPKLGSKKNRLIMYHGMFFVGMAVNSLVTILVHYLWHLPSLVALATGSAVALFINFLTSRFLVWRSSGSIDTKQ